MNNMVMTTINSTQLTEKQNERLTEVTAVFGDGIKDVASVFIKYADIIDKTDVVFCEYVHKALELLKKSKEKNKNKKFCEMTGIEYTKITKCDKVYNEVIDCITDNLAQRANYLNKNEMLNDYSFSQLYIMTQVKNSAVMEMLFLEHVHNYTTSELTFLIKDITSKGIELDIASELFDFKKSYIAEKNDIKKFYDSYALDTDNTCYKAIVKTEPEKPEDEKTEAEKPKDEKPNESKADESKAGESKVDESKADESKADKSKADKKTLDINAILEYIRSCNDINELQSIKAVAGERIKAIKK